MNMHKQTEPCIDCCTEREPFQNGEISPFELGYICILGCGCVHLPDSITEKSFLKPSTNTHEPT